MFLAIDTATRQMGVAVVDETRLLSSYELLADYPHAAELPGAVTRVLEAASTSLERLEAIIVDLGPGSFTGLRIGLAFVKALAFSRKIPLVGVPSLEVLAANLPFSPKPVCPVVDAKQRNVYAARYRLEAGRPVKQSDYFLGPVDEFLAQMKEPAVFLGDGAALYADRIRAQRPDAQFADPELSFPRAATLARLGRERFRRGEQDDPATLVPLYLYPQDCQVRGPGRPTSVLPRATPASATS